MGSTAYPLRAVGSEFALPDVVVQGLLTVEADAGDHWRGRWDVVVLAAVRTRHVVVISGHCLLVRTLTARTGETRKFQTITSPRTLFI